MLCRHAAYFTKIQLFPKFTEEFETYDDDILILAIQNENACNPVLRAGAQATIERYVILYNT